MHIMPRGKLRPTLAEVKALLAADRDFLRPLVQVVLQELLEAEMTETLGAGKGERTPDRFGYRSGYYGRTLISRVGKLELRVPQDRAGRFSTELFERYQRSEKALVAALAEMYVQGVSTRKVKAITEELCGHSFSASAISTINARLDEELARFARRRLDDPYPYLILDARYERVREAGVIRSPAVLLAIGIGWDGRRSILTVELANRESRSSWRDFLLELRERGLSASSSWSRTTTRGSSRRSSRCCPRSRGNAVTSTSCATRWTTCRARSLRGVRGPTARGRAARQQQADADSAIGPRPEAGKAPAQPLLDHGLLGLHSLSHGRPANLARPAWNGGRRRILSRLRGIGGRTDGQAARG
jgi:Transposase, Mutator family